MDPPVQIGGYTTKAVARLLGLSVVQIRTFVRDGFLSPARGERGAYLFTFRDLVLLRTARDLMKAQITPSRVRSALSRISDRLPEDRPLSEVKVFAEGEAVVAHDTDGLWQPESGQVLFSFDEEEGEEAPIPIEEPSATLSEDLTAEDWYGLGLELELASERSECEASQRTIDDSVPVVGTEEARDAYRRALELDPFRADIRVSLGRTLCRIGLFCAAEAHFRLALEARPDDPLAAFHLGTTLEELGKKQEAVSAYTTAIASEPYYREAYQSLAALYDRLEQPELAAKTRSACSDLNPGKS